MGRRGGEVATHENMTFLGRRCLEKGRRSGSLLFHSFMLPVLRHAAAIGPACSRMVGRKGCVGPPSEVPEGKGREGDGREGGGSRAWKGK